MLLSSIILIVWVFLVSIATRGWAVDFDLGTWIFIVGIVYVVVRIFEALGKAVTFKNLRK